jgi:hypothetical protein
MQPAEYDDGLRGMEFYEWTLVNQQKDDSGQPAKNVAEPAGDILCEAALRRAARGGTLSLTALRTERGAYRDISTATATKRHGCLPEKESETVARTLLNPAKRRKRCLVPRRGFCRMARRIESRA